MKADNEAIPECAACRMSQLLPRVRHVCPDAVAPWALSGDPQKPPSCKDMKSRPQRKFGRNFEHGMQIAFRCGCKDKLLSWRTVGSEGLIAERKEQTGGMNHAEANRGNRAVLHDVSGSLPVHLEVSNSHY